MAKSSSCYIASPTTYRISIHCFICTCRLIAMSKLCTVIKTITVSILRVLYELIQVMSSFTMWIFVCTIALCVPYNPDAELQEFIKKTIIPNFHKQREEGDQFAVLIIEASLRNIVFQPCDNTGRPHVDRDHPFYPPTYQCVNYIAARPHKAMGFTIHTEKILMQQLESLWANYRKNFHAYPNHIILYSWMMPCSHCTQAIIGKMSKYTSTGKVVAYTINWKGIPEDENENNRTCLQQAGIHVIRVRYSQCLPIIDISCHIL